MDGENVAVNGRPGGPPQPPSSCGPLLDQQTTNYTIPGILHFIKHEWSRFEKEKANWEVERAELQVHIKPRESSLEAMHSWAKVY